MSATTEFRQQALAIAEEHVAWARQAGWTLDEVFAPMTWFGRRTWDTAPEAVAQFWLAHIATQFFADAA